jgi:hypothetical protein
MEIGSGGSQDRAQQDLDDTRRTVARNYRKREGGSEKSPNKKLPG